MQLRPATVAIDAKNCSVRQYVTILALDNLTCGEVLFVFRN
jgi:hypothetical protein